MQNTMPERVAIQELTTQRLKQITRDFSEVIGRSRHTTVYKVINKINNTRASSPNCGYILFGKETVDMYMSNTHFPKIWANQILLWCHVAFLL